MTTEVPPPEEPPEDGWETSSYSGANNDCVEVNLTGAGTWVRDSKDPTGGAFKLSDSGWLGLLDAVRNGLTPNRTES